MYSFERQQTDVYAQFMEGHLEAFYRFAFGLLMVYAERLLGTGLAYMAEDCVQDAVFETYEKRGGMASPAHLKQYLYRCVHNNALSLLRKDQSRSRYLSADGDEAESDHSLEIIRQETFERLAFAVEQLPPDLREMAALVFREGLSGQEVAARLGLSLSGVKKRKARLLQTLRSLVSDDGLMMLAALLLGR